MALVKKQSNATRAVIILLVGLAVAGLGYFLFQRFSSPSVDNSAAGAGGGEKVISNFGESILDDPRYKSLQPFVNESITVDPTQDGHNNNPFE